MFLKEHFFLAVCLILVLSSCKKDDDSAIPPPLQTEFTVDPYTNFSLAGDVSVKFKNVDQTQLKAGSEFLVKIYGTEEQRNAITVVSSNGTLRITADDWIVLGDSVRIELSTPDLVEIRLESNQQAVFWGIEQDDLTVVTEANSQLSLLESKIGNLTSVQEGESILNLTNFSDILGIDTVYPQNQGVLLNDTTLLVDNTYLITGDSITLSEVEPFSWTVYGDAVRERFMITYCDFKTEGSTTIHAVEAPTWEVNIKLEASSHAEVWAVDRITGKGEGSSVLYYRGDPDISGFITEGGAQIIPLN
jgi:hypothetical protein